MWKAMRSKNACKTCALGMGGQRGGMVNESGHFPEVCKKSIQAAAADLQPAIPENTSSPPPPGNTSRSSPRARWSRWDASPPRWWRSRARPATASPPGRRHSRAWATASRRSKPERSFFCFSGRSSNEAGFLLQLFARIWGTNNVNNCSFYCHQASGVGLGSMFGSGTGTVQLADLDKTDLLVLIGGNPSSNHPRFMRTLMELKRRGGSVVVVNPLREIGL